MYQKCKKVKRQSKDKVIKASREIYETVNITQGEHYKTYIWDIWKFIDSSFGNISY